MLPSRGLVDVGAAVVAAAAAGPLLLLLSSDKREELEEDEGKLSKGLAEGGNRGISAVVTDDAAAAVFVIGFEVLVVLVELIIVVLGVL